MAEMDGAVGQAAGAGKLDVVGAQHLQHLGTYQPHDQRDLEDGQRDGRQHDVVPALERQQAAGPPVDVHHLTTPEAGEPAQSHGEQQDQQDADQEGGQRDPQQGQGHEHLADEGAAAQGGIDTHRDADQQSQSGGDECQFQRGGKAFGDQARDLGALAQAQAKLALHGVDQKMPELNHKGLVKAQIGTQLVDLFLGGVLPEQEHHRITHVLEQQECDERDRHHDDRRLDQALKDESQHQFILKVDPWTDVIAIAQAAVSAKIARNLAVVVFMIESSADLELSHAIEYAISVLANVTGKSPWWCVAHQTGATE